MIGSYLLVHECDGTAFQVEPADMGSIDAAVTSFIEKGIDSLIYMDGLSGSRIVLLASRITGWQLLSSESRANHYEIEKELANEREDEEKKEWER